ncbi:MAG: Ig-like domain-containing protein [Pirellulaceae bacterium]
MPLAGDAVGALSGTIWFDQNQDAIRDPNEPSLPGVIVYLDKNGNGVRDEQEPFVLTQSDDPLTLDLDEAGIFHFDNLPDGDYTLAVDLPEHAQWVFPDPELIVNDVIENGSFEEDSPTERFSGWQDSSTDSLLRWQRAEEGEWGFQYPSLGANIEPTSPQDGDWIAAHKFYANLTPTTYTLQQHVSLGTGDEAELRFQSRIQWNHQLGALSSGDFQEPHSFTVFILDPDSETPLAEFRLLETDITPGYREGDTKWLHYSINLSAFLDQEIIVQFHCDAPTVNAGVGQFELDAVELLVRSTPPVPLGQHVSISGGVPVGEIDFGIHSTLGFNPPPSIDAPASAFTSEDTPLVFDAAEGLGIQLEAVPGGENFPRLELSVDVGTLQLGSQEGIVFITGTGEGDSHLAIEGTLESLQWAIDGLQVTPPENYHGNATISLDLDDQNDDAFQGRQSVQHTISLEVTSVNDPPLVAQPIDPMHVSRGTETISLDLSPLFDDVDIHTSDDQLTLSVSPNSQAQWIATQLDLNQLQLQLDPQFHGTAEIEITATDLAGDFATFVLLVSVREKFDLEMTLVGQESADQPGSVVTEIPRNPLHLHEWEPVTAQFWFTPTDGQSQGMLQISVDFDPLLWSPGEILTVEGATIETVVHTDESGTWLELEISQWDLAAIEASDSILLATLALVPALDSPTGVPMSDLTARPAASSEVGISLREAGFGEMASPLTTTTSEGAELLPVIFDLDDSGRIGLADFTRFISSYGQASTPENSAALAADFTQSGRVGLSDFVLFIQNYGRRKEEHPTIIFPEILQLESESEPDSEEPDGGELLEGEPISEAPPAAQLSDPWQFGWIDSATSHSVQQDNGQEALRGDDLQSRANEASEWSAIITAEIDQLWACLAAETDSQRKKRLAGEADSAWSSELSLPSEFRAEEIDDDLR